MEAYGITWLVLCCITFVAKVWALLTVNYPVKTIQHANDTILEICIIAGIIAWGLNIFA